MVFSEMKVKCSYLIHPINNYNLGEGGIIQNYPILIILPFFLKPQVSILKKYSIFFLGPQLLSIFFPTPHFVLRVLFILMFLIFFLGYVSDIVFS